LAQTFPKAGATGVPIFSTKGLRSRSPDVKKTYGHDTGHCPARLCSLPGRRLSAGLRRRSSSAALCQLKDMCRQTDLQQISRRIFCCCRFKT